MIHIGSLNQQQKEEERKRMDLGREEGNITVGRYGEGGKC
jgi:hypothetical protein